MRAIGGSRRSVKRYWREALLPPCLNFNFFSSQTFIFIQLDHDLWVVNINFTFPKHGKNFKVFLFQIIVLFIIFHDGFRSEFALLPFCSFAPLPICPFAHLPFCPFALISHNVLPSNFALALAIYVAIQATIMARAREKFEGKRLCEIRAKGQK